MAVIFEAVPLILPVIVFENVSLPPKVRLPFKRPRVPPDVPVLTKAAEPSPEMAEVPIAIFVFEADVICPSALTV